MAQASSQESLHNQNPTPPHSRTSSRSSGSKRPKSNLSLDLSDVPSLIEPTPPSNTLLVTNLNDPAIFLHQTLSYLHDLLSQSIPSNDVDENGDPAILHTISPLPSFRRIILTFTSTSAAIAVRTVLDGESLSKYLSANATSISDSEPQPTNGHRDDRIRVYFGAEVPLKVLNATSTTHLYPPKADKQFFISPPPSPPAGWTMREEDPPNKDVHAHDLASALAKVDSTEMAASAMETEALNSKASFPTPKEDDNTPGPAAGPSRQRTGSFTRVVYRPQDQGLSPDLPAISVEDTTPVESQMDVDVSPVDMEGDGQAGSKILAHTARPSVELMS